MSNPYGPTIETLDEWNSALGCCCGMPACPEPILEMMGVSGSLTVSFYSGHFTDLAGTRYKVETTTHGGCSYVVTDTLASYYSGFLPDGTFSLDNLTTAVTGSLSGWDSTTVTTKTAPITWADWITGAKSLITANFAAMDESDWGSAPLSYSQLSHPSAYSAPDTSFAVAMLFNRYRWRIPSSHLGSYFKLTWDVVFIPDAGAPAAVLTDETWEWTGPGTGAYDDPSWRSSWYALDPPSTPGKRKVVNVRFECYRGPYGSKPQTIVDE